MNRLQATAKILLLWLSGLASPAMALTFSVSGDGAAICNAGLVQPALVSQSDCRLPSGAVCEFGAPDCRCPAMSTDVRAINRFIYVTHEQKPDGEVKSTAAKQLLSKANSEVSILEKPIDGTSFQIVSLYLATENYGSTYWLDVCLNSANIKNETDVEASAAFLPTDASTPEKNYATRAQLQSQHNVSCAAEKCIVRFTFSEKATTGRGWTNATGQFDLKVVSVRE